MGVHGSKLLRWEYRAYGLWFSELTVSVLGLIIKDLRVHFGPHLAEGLESSGAGCLQRSGFLRLLAFGVSP